MVICLSNILNVGLLLVAEYFYTVVFLLLLKVKHPSTSCSSVFIIKEYISWVVGYEWQKHRTSDKPL